MSWALHAANIVILFSFLVRDIIFLRCLSIVAGVLFCVYFYQQKMMEPIVWNTLFSAVNFIQITRMYLLRRKIPLSLEEQYVYERFFPSLQPLEIRALVQAGTIRTFQATEDISCTGIALLVQGAVIVQEEHIHAGFFLGIRGFLERKEYLALGSALQSISMISWTFQDMRAWAEGISERNTLLLKALSTDLIKRMQFAQNSSSRESQ